jgi:Fic family protein
VPPSPEDVQPALRDLESFLNAEPAMPAVIVAGLAHVQFETIHPFIDGNGRTGRLLLTLLLCQRKVLSQPLLYLSEYFKRRRAEYYDRLQAVRDDGDWEGWIRFYLNGIAEVAGEAALTARKIIALRESHRQLVTEQMKHSSGNALSFLERLYFRPVVTVRAVQDMTQVSFSNASKLVARFEELGILREMTGQRRNRRFKYAEYLALFTPEEDE